MYRINTGQQDSFIDPFDFLGPKRKALLESSWAALFRKHLFDKIPVKKIQSRFHATMGRPSTDDPRKTGEFSAFGDCARSFVAFSLVIC